MSPEKSTERRRMRSPAVVLRPFGPGVWPACIANPLRDAYGDAGDAVELKSKVCLHNKSEAPYRYSSSDALDERSSMKRLRLSAVTFRCLKKKGILYNNRERVVCPSVTLCSYRLSRAFWAKILCPGGFSGSLS